MAFVQVKLGDQKVLEVVKSYFSNCVLGLFKNNQTPISTHSSANYTAGDFTISPDTNMGYYDTPTNDGTMGVMSINSSITFTYTGSGNQTIYGWYLMDSTTLIWAENFGSALTVSNSSDKIIVTAHTYKMHTP